MAGWSYRGARSRAALHRTALGAVVLACAAAVTASAVRPPPTPPAGPAGRDTAVRVLQMNLCDSGAARCYTGRSVAEATDLIHSEGPDVVTLNEVCRGDVAALEHAIADTGTDGVVVSGFQAAWDRRTAAPVRCRNGQPYGIGLVARLPAATYETVGSLYPMQDARVPEERAWLCVSPAATAALPPDAVAVCTTHLTNSNATVAGAQCRYVLGTAVPAIRARAGSVPVVLGGDFNLRSDGAQDVRSCLPAGDQRADDGIVQHVVATPEFVVGSRRTIGMRMTDHPGLLVNLTLGRPGASVPAVE